MGDEQDEKDEVSIEEVQSDNTPIDSDMSDEEWHPFEEIQDDFQPSPQLTVFGPDGLPTQHAEVNDNAVPPLSCKTLVCMGDFSSFVTRSRFGKIIETHTPDKVTRDSHGRYFVPIKDGFGKDGYGLVGPIRPPCKHYIRQVSQMPESPTNKVHYRLCSARRTTEGAFMSLRDTALWACTMREPRDLDSEREFIDSFDNQKIKEGATRVTASIFGDGKKHERDY